MRLELNHEHSGPEKTNYDDVGKGRRPPTDMWYRMFLTAAQWLSCLINNCMCWPFSRHVWTYSTLLANGQFLEGGPHTMQLTRLTVPRFLFIPDTVHTEFGVNVRWYVTRNCSPEMPDKWQEQVFLAMEDMNLNAQGDNIICIFTQIMMRYSMKIIIFRKLKKIFKKLLAFGPVFTHHFLPLPLLFSLVYARLANTDNNIVVYV